MQKISHGKPREGTHSSDLVVGYVKSLHRNVTEGIEAQNSRNQMADRDGRTTCNHSTSQITSQKNSMQINSIGRSIEQQQGDQVWSINAIQLSTSRKSVKNFTPGEHTTTVFVSVPVFSRLLGFRLYIVIWWLKIWTRRRWWHYNPGRTPLQSPFPHSLQNASRQGANSESLFSFTI